MIEWLIAAAVGAVLGYVVSWLVARSQKQVLATRMEVLQQQLEQVQLQSDKVVQEMNARQEEIKAEARKQLEETKADEQRRMTEAKAEWQKQTTYALDAQQARFDETIAKVTAQLKTATDEMLKQRQKEFAESSHTNLGQIVNPLRETIDNMKKAMNESTLKQTSMSSEMKANIENMMRQSEAAKKSADELARVFKHGSKVQGDWGETVLDELFLKFIVGHILHHLLIHRRIPDLSATTGADDEAGFLQPRLGNQILVQQDATLCIGGHVLGGLGHLAQQLAGLGHGGLGDLLQEAVPLLKGVQADTAIQHAGGDKGVAQFLAELDGHENATLSVHIVFKASIQHHTRHLQFVIILGAIFVSPTGLWKTLWKVWKFTTSHHKVALSTTYAHYKGYFSKNQ